MQIIANALIRKRRTAVLCVFGLNRTNNNVSSCTWSHKRKKKISCDIRIMSVYWILKIFHKIKKIWTCLFWFYVLINYFICQSWQLFVDFVQLFNLKSILHSRYSRYTRWLFTKILLKCSLVVVVASVCAENRSWAPLWYDFFHTVF